MTDSVTCTVHGLKELAEALKQMPQKLAGKALGAAVAAGAAIIRDQARANAPVGFLPKRWDHETIKKSIVVYRGRGSRPWDIHYEIGVTMQKKWYRSLKRGGVRKLPAYWWHFNEFGTSKQAARPFLRPAFDQQSGRALAAIKMMLEKAVVIAAAQVPKYRGNG